MTREADWNAVQLSMREGYDKLIKYVSQPSFQAVLLELFGLPRSQRPWFVKSVLLSEENREKLNIKLPDGVLLVRSTFGDRRPSLFCVKTYLPEKLWKPWQNVNITFDEHYADTDIPRDARAWRPGLGFEEQAALMAAEKDYREVAFS